MHTTIPNNLLLLLLLHLYNLMYDMRQGILLLTYLLFNAIFNQTSGLWIQLITNMEAMTAPFYE